MTEIVFSLLRRILKGTSIYHPDTAHLHLKLFYFFKANTCLQENSQFTRGPILSLLWLLPLIAITWTYQRPNFIWVAIILFVIFYEGIYILLTTTQKNARKK
jgi:hypothetical protein